MADTRAHPRVALSVQVEYRTAGSFLVAYSANLSKGGMFLEADRPLQPGTELLLRFRIAGETTIELFGMVAWVRDAPAGGMGIQFDSTDEKLGAIVDTIVAAFRGLRLLVVAADPQVRNLLARTVKSVLASAEVIEGGDAREAQELLDKEPDLVVVDLDDDPADGLMALRMAKALPRAVPVIAIGREESLRAEARELGADEVLATAVANADLPNTVLRVIGRPTRVEAV